MLRSLSRTTPWSGSFGSTIGHLTDSLTAAQAESLPNAIGKVLPLLRGDVERLRYAAEITVRLDLYEAAASVADLAASTNDRDLLMAAATLCGNPAVNPAVRRRVAHMVRADRAGMIRIDPGTTPFTGEEKYLYRQCWPGKNTDDHPYAVAPVVVLDRGFDARHSFRFAVSLDRAGAVVRRLASDGKVPLWFGSHTILVCRPKTRTRVLSAYPRFPEAHIILELPRDGGHQLGQLLRRINDLLTGPQKLRLHKLPVEVTTNLWAPDVFSSGVYPTKEIAVLSGSSRSSLDYLRRRVKLTPLSFQPIRWTFRDLVAFRTWSYLKSVSPGRVLSDVVPALAQFAGDSDAVRIGVTTDGSVLVDRGDGWANVATGQRPLDLDITNIDDVFQPFSFGNGVSVPLPTVSRNTTLNPAVLNGTPYLKGHRISAKNLASLDRRNGRQAILSAYPELENVSFDDTVRVGHQILSAR